MIKEFIEEIKNLNKDSFMVKNKIHYIELYSKEKTWVYISTIDLMDIKENLIPLFTSIDDNEDAKRFDNLMYQLQVKRIRQDKTNKKNQRTQRTFVSLPLRLCMRWLYFYWCRV